MSARGTHPEHRSREGRGLQGPGKILLEWNIKLFTLRRSPHRTPAAARAEHSQAGESAAPQVQVLPPEPCPWGCEPAPDTSLGENRNPAILCTTDLAGASLPQPLTGV